MDEKKVEFLLQELKELLDNVKADAEDTWNKYRFLQMQLDMLDDRLHAIEEHVGIDEVEIEPDFDF